MIKPHLIYRIALLSILMAIVWIGNLQAQQFEWISNDFPGSRFLEIIEKDGKYYGVISNGALPNFDPNTIYQLSIYEIEFNNAGEPGITLNQVATIPFPDNFATADIDYIEETGTWLLVQTSVISDQFQKYRVVLYDKDFNFITASSKDTLGSPIPFHIDSYGGKTYVLGSIQGPPMDEIFFCEYSHSNPYFLPPIIIKQSDPYQMTFITSMNIDKRTGDMLVFFYEGIAELDTNLHQNNRVPYNQIHTASHGYVIGTENNYYSHGATFQGLGNGDRFLVFQRYDTLFNVIMADTFGIKGQDNYPFLTRSLDHRNNEFLIGGHLDGPFNSANFYSHIKKFYLAKYDNEMHQLWYKEYGGDRPYILFGLKLIEDGSSIAYGAIYDTLNGLRYAYIMHVDENGEILTSTTIPQETKSSIQVVNPGNETLQVLNPDNIQVRIELYDLLGCNVLSSDIHSGLNEIDVQGLPVGLYPYIFFNNGRAISSGKWVKGN